MAQTKRKRQTKHRGNAAGVVESRGRTGRKPTKAEKEGKPRTEQQIPKRDRPPTWLGAFYRAMAAAVLMLLVSLFLLKKPNEAIALFPIVLIFYIPISYYTDMWLYNRRMRSKAKQAVARRPRDERPSHEPPGVPPASRRAAGKRTMSEMIDIRSFTVGPVQENAYILRRAGAGSAVLIDPGDEPERLLAAIDDLGVRIEAILITHCHFDHIGAVAPLARATGAPVYCPEIERPVLEDIRLGTPPGFGPFESYVPEHTLAGGESVSLADLDIEVLLTPGHSPGHLTFSLPAHAAILSGDVLFQGSIGRTDLPYADHPTLERTLATLVRTLAPETTVYPGHMGITTLGRELATNPFLVELRPAPPVSRPSPVRGEAPRPDGVVGR